MPQPIIYYLFSKETDTVVRGLITDQKLRGFHFQRVNRDQVKHIDDEVAALLWGSGFQHDVSHLFSPKGNFHKVIYDGHEDNVPRSGLHMGSHTVYTARLARCKRVTVHVLPEDRKLQRYQKRAHRIGEIYRKHSNIDNTRGKRVHLSIDLDCIIGYPAHPDHQRFEDCGFALDDVREGVRGVIAKNRVVRFDIGGLFLPGNKDLCRYEYQGMVHKANPKDKGVFEFGANCYKALLKEFLGVY